MSIIGHWKATTGFDTSTYTVTMGKPVADCTDAELAAHPLCGSISPFCNVAYTSAADGMSGNYMNHLAGSCGFSEPITSGHSEQWAVPPKSSEDLRKQYRRIIFVAAPTGVSIPSRCITESADSRILIVEDIKNPNKLVLNYGNTPGGNTYYTFPFTASIRCKHTCNRGQSTWNSAPDQIEYTDTTDPDNPQTTYYYLYPIWLYVYSNVSYLIRDEFLDQFGGIYRAGEPDINNWNYIYTSKNYQSFSQVTPEYLAMGYNPNPGGEATTLKDLLGAGAYADPVPDPAQFITTPYEYPTTNLSPDGTGTVYGFTMSNSTSAGYRVCSLNIQLFKGNEWYLAGSMCRMGCYFVNNGELLKPIIEGGIVIGYGTPDQESELDDYTDLNHPVPSTPGGGGGGGNDEDDSKNISTVGVPFASGLAHYYVTTVASPVLEQISEAMSTWDIDTTKKDLYRNLISCKLIKPPAPVPSTSGVFTIYGVKPQYQGSDITITEVTGNPTASFGPYSISRKFNDFRDYAPYTKCEIFLPYCGWCGLPSHVVGRRISVEYYTDIIAATCKAVVYCISGEGRNIIAEASGVIGVDIPFASENVGAKMQAANAGLVASTKGALQTAIGVGTLVSTKGQKGVNSVASGLSNYISGFTQMSMAANENWTEINGQTGDGCNLAGASTIIIKITRPKYGSNSDAPYVPTGYAHNIGFTAMQEVNVGSVSGLLIADNVDTSGISGATERERAEIKRLLETGIIV